MKHTFEIKSRGDVLTESQSSLCYKIFVGSFLLSIIIAFIEPSMIDSKSVTVLNCYSGSLCLELEGENAMWRAHLNNIVLENQAISLYMTPHCSEKLAFSSNLLLSVLGVDTETATEGQQILTNTKNCDIRCGSYNRGDCNLFFLPMIEYSSYIVELSFLDSIPQQVTSIKFQLEFVNPDFTFWRIALRFSFFCLSLVSLFIHLLNVCAIPIRDLYLIDKLMVAMNVSLVLFNQPLFAVKIYEPSESIFFFSSFCSAQFEFIVFGFFIIMYIEAEYSRRDLKLHKYRYLGILLTVNFVLVLILYTEIDSQSRYGLNYGRNSAFFHSYICVCIGLFVLGIIVWIIIMMIVQLDFYDSELLVFDIYLASTNCLRVLFVRTPYYYFSTILISGINLLVFASAFYGAPKQISVIHFQDFKKLGREIEDDFGDELDPETEEDKEIESFKLIK